MKTYQITSKQFLPISIDKGWEFLSKPENLGKITPPDMQFNIVSQSGEGTYAGQIIKYKIKVPPGVKLDWMTEITHVNAPHYFVDEQRTGPYALWHHQHHLKSVEGGIEMTDEVNYALPLGFLGVIAHTLFVKRQLKGVFDYRYQILKELFKKDA
jgi:ligand-binding SRPBCC domain-containing protein